MDPLSLEPGTVFGLLGPRKAWPTPKLHNLHTLHPVTGAMFGQRLVAHLLCSLRGVQGPAAVGRETQPSDIQAGTPFVPTLANTDCEACP